VAPPLHDWETFYVIVGSSAAALTGLQFVVIALLSEAREVDANSESLHAFGTPTVVHFCAVLLISALCSMPGHSSATLALCLTTSGLAGLGYVLTVIRRARRQTEYKAVFEDWLWHTILPTIAYFVLFAAGLFAVSRAGGSLYFVASSALCLLFVGIHNAWDTAVYIAAQRGRSRT
jgi:hypothetical protein